MAQITYDNKVKLNDDPNIPDINKVTDDDMNEIKDVVNGNYLTEQADFQGLKPFALWENPNISATNFGPQTITLSSADYDYLEVYYYVYNDRRAIQSLKTFKGEDFELMTVFSHDAKMWWGARLVHYVNDTTFEFKDAYSADPNAIPAPAITNDWIIPIKILGYKY